MAQQTKVGQGLLNAEDSRAHSDTSQSVGPLWTTDRPDAETSLPDNAQNLQKTEIHATGGIGARSLSRRAAACPSLRPRGHWDRLADTQAYRGFHAFL
jgi:hypothetical protein